MPRIEEQIDINAARADVFRFCHDLSNRAEWDEQVLSVELITPKPVRQGTLLRIDAKSGNSVFSWEAEYTGYQMLQSSALKAIDTASASPFARGSVMTWEFDSTGSGTRMTWVWDYKPRGVIASILDVLGKRSATHRAIKRSMDNLKSLVEAGRRATIN